jgi:hypothetical protein
LPLAELGAKSGRKARQREFHPTCAEAAFNQSAVYSIIHYKLPWTVRRDTKKPPGEGRLLKNKPNRIPA